MAALRWPAKDPEEVLDYQIDWDARIEDGDAITASTWVRTGADTVLTIGATSFTDTTSTVWLSAGTLGVTYSLTNHITTSGGRTMELTVRLKIAAK